MAKKDVFLRVLNDSRTSVVNAAKLGQQITRDAQFVRDVGDCAENFVNGLPDEQALDPQSWDHLIGTFDSVLQRSKAIERMDTAVGSFTAAVSGTGMTMTTIFKVVTLEPTYDPTVLGRPIDQFYRLLDKNDLAAEVRTLIIRFRLDNRAGANRSPLELFNDAIRALDMPVDAESPAAITLSLRESIDQMIDRLLKRRQKQEPTKGRPAKIISLGKQCANPGLSTDHFNRLGIDAESLQNELSGTKPMALPREELIKLFERGALFIKALLGSIDESKLKPI